MRRSLGRYKQDWEVVAELDPLWGILAEPIKKFAKWKVDEFFLRGEHEVIDLMHCAVKLGYPENRDCALDFGCGVGRTTIALANHFRQCYGVDISELMIEKARTLKNIPLESSLVYESDNNLERFSDDTFDLVYSMFVLQHFPQRSTMKYYIKEFVRVLKKNGLLVFQVPTFIPFLYRFHLGIKLYRILTIVRVSKKMLYKRFGLLPIVMNFIPDQQVRTLLSSQHARVLDIRVALDSSGVCSSTYYVTK